jgi:hypothetical protein
VPVDEPSTGITSGLIHRNIIGETLEQLAQKKKDRLTAVYQKYEEVFGLRRLRAQVVPYSSCVARL